VAIRPDSTAKKQIEPEPEDRGIRSAPLKPIRVVVRELTRPDGKKLKVQVPVYPPFQLEEREEREKRPIPGAPRSRKEPKARGG
jgi:bifunctional pyridoxal-dependent enzyme with beta-cystathionase and maltose regulon repressor activities